MDKEFAEEFGVELTEGKVEELGKQIAGIAHKFKEGKDDVMTMADEMITNGAMPDPEMIKMLETEEADMIRHLIAKKMGIQWTKDNGYGEMRFKQNYPESTDMVMNLLGKKKNKIEEANLNDYVAKFKQKMGKTTHQTMTDWVDGIGGLTKRENKTLKRVLKPFTEAKEREISHSEYLKHGAGKGGKQWSTGAGKNKKYWTHRKEEVEIDEVLNVGKMSDKKLKDFIGQFDPDERMGQAAAMQLKAARKEAQKRGLKLEEVEIDEMSNRKYKEKINSLLKDYHGKFKWRDEVLYVTKEIEKDVRSIISKDKGHSYMVKVSKNPMREEVEIKEYVPSFKVLPQSVKDVYKILSKKNWVLKQPMGDDRVIKLLKKHNDPKKVADVIIKKHPLLKDVDNVEGIDIEKASMGDVIKDFKTSDAPQFKGKSDKKRKEMAIAAKLSREENEDDDPVGKKKKKSKKDVINLKPTAESSMKKLKDIMIKMKEKRSNNVDEAVNLKKLKKEYEENEDKNYHRENYLLLAKAFGTRAEIKKVEEIMKRSEANNSTSQKDNDWMYKNINKYYDKIRNEEVEVEESDGYEVDLAAKKIQHKWKRMSKAEKVRFLDKMDVLAGKTKVSDSDLEDILGDYGLTMEATGDKEAYQKFFQSALKKFGVKSPAELKGDKKKEFFDYVDKNWTGDHEEQTKKEQVMTKKSLKDAVYGMKKKKSKVTEAITIGGLEVGEQEFDKGARLDHVAPNLGMTYKDYQAKFETNGMEGPYQIDGGAYFWDKMASKWFSVETEDYVDEKRNAELNFRYTKGGSAGGGMLYQRSYNN